MSIGVCIPCCNRETYLQILLAELPRYLIEVDKVSDFHIYIGTPIETDQLFNAALARNMAALTAINDGCDELVLQDIDVYPSDGINYRRHRGNVTWFLSAGGCKVSSRDFLQVNGWNPRFTGWGDEDAEFFHRLHMIGPTEHWPTTEEASRAKIVNLEWEFSDQPSYSENAKYWGGTGAGPQFKRYRRQLDRPDKRVNWYSTEIQDRNHRLWQSIFAMSVDEKIPYFKSNGLNLICPDTAVMQDRRFATQIFYSPEKVLI